MPTLYSKPPLCRKVLPVRKPSNHFVRLSLLMAVLAFAMWCIAEVLSAEEVEEDSGVTPQQTPSNGSLHLSDDEQADPAIPSLPTEEELRISRNLQPATPLAPPLTQQPEVPLPSSAADFSQRLTSTPTSTNTGVVPPAPGTSGNPISVDGSQSVGRATSDVGSLLSKSPSATGITSQRRTPLSMILASTAVASAVWRLRARIGFPLELIWTLRSASLIPAAFRA
jgi:hypothetical protein